jgi:nitrogen regulatory protein PII
LICTDDDPEKFMNIILEKAHTGQKGDGEIFISEISDAVSIRTKLIGAAAI